MDTMLFADHAKAIAMPCTRVSAAAARPRAAVIGATRGEAFTAPGFRTWSPPLT